MSGGAVGEEKPVGGIKEGGIAAYLVDTLPPTVGEMAEKVARNDEVEVFATETALVLEGGVGDVVALLIATALDTKADGGCIFVVVLTGGRGIRSPLEGDAKAVDNLSRRGRIKGGVY